jgi:ribokinase
MRVAVFGDINLDLAVVIDTFPAPGEEVFATTSRIGLGGSAVNTAVSLARLGVSTTVVAQVGDDPFGKLTITELARVGIDTSRVAVSPTEATGLNLVTVSGDGERGMIGMRGANVTYGGEPDWLGDTDWLHLSGYALLAEPQRGAARRALTAAKEAGVPVSVDVPAGVGARIGPSLAAELAGCHLVSGGTTALIPIAGPLDPIEALLALGVERVAVTAGAAICRLADGAGSVAVTPPAVEPVDATGAGDSFVAGLVAARMAGLALGPSLVVATALGAAATTHRGAGAALGDTDRIRSILDGNLWVDAEPEWLEQATRFLAN